MNTCECECGKDAGVYARTRRGHKQGEPRRFVRGHNSGGTAHGMSKLQNGKHSPEYQAYVNAKRRCTNPKSEDWKLYGGRGIKFLFNSFQQFFAELGMRPEGKTLDRINTNGHYIPGNVRWATWEQQRENQRKQRGSTSQHKYIYYKKEINKWVVQLSTKGKKRQVGTYNTEAEAKVALDKENHD